MIDTPTTFSKHHDLPGLVVQPALRLLVVASLLLSVGCAGSDPTGPIGPTFSPLAVTTTSLPDAAVDVAYGAQTLTATGGDGSYSWALASGRQPTGLRLDANGVITGTPTAVEARSFTIQVTSGDGQSAQRTLSIAVTPPPMLQPTELCSENPEYARATFEDPNLEGAVRTALSVDAQFALTCGLLATVERLDAPALGITSLAGIQNLPSLWDLDLNNNGITDIAPLASLTDLWFLNLNFNSITDLSAVSGLTDLSILFVGNNSVTDIGGLSGLANLENLSLENNPVTDIHALSGLTDITDLRLRATAIADYGPLGGLTRLEYLELSGNAITDVTTLSGLLSGHSRLWHLGLSDNSITDLGPLGGLTSVTYLGLSNNSFTDIGALGGLTRLERLYLTENSITDVSALHGLTTLTYVGLSDNPDLDDIEPLLNNTGLGAGVSVTLFRTKVGCADVAALRAKGVTVHTATCP